MDLVRALRILIVLEVALAALYAAADTLLESALPAPLQEFLSEKYEAPLSAMDYLQLAIGAPLLVALLTAWAGLWRLKPWARHLYSAATAFGILAVPISGPFVTHGIAEMLSEAGIVISGMTLALIWLSPLAARFRAEAQDAWSS